MSFDLYFYRKKGDPLDRRRFEKFLEENGCERENESFQWVYSNDRTNVYFIFEYVGGEVDEDDSEVFENFEEFENTGYVFQLNFCRPNFFGLEAFGYIARLVDEFDLFVLNPQSKSDPDNPQRETSEQYYADWESANLTFSADYFDDLELLHFPIEKSNNYWEYNFDADRLQETLGDDYYVPSLLIARLASSGELVTVTTWTEHIPTVIPPADVFVLLRKKKGFWRTTEEKGIISRETFDKAFANYCEPFGFKDCRVIHPSSAESAANTFDSVKFEADLEGYFGDGVEIESLTNAERSHIQKRLDDD